jgi:signal transduction histidine kinase
MFQADCKAKDLNLSLVLGDSLKILGPKPMIKADPTRLQQTIVNLCSNAIKFTSLQAKREVTIRVDVNLKAPDEHESIVPPPDPPLKTLPDGHPVWLYVSVSDTGPGMTPHELSKLFKKFTQANTEVHTQMGGNGLGLFIAKQLCELQDGRIEAVSTKQAPTGSVFRFFIRAASVVKPTEMIRSRSTPLFPADDSKTGSMYILVVDDNEINRKTLSRQLKMYKHKVKMAGDGQETLVSRCRGVRSVRP